MKVKYSREYTISLGDKTYMFVKPMVCAEDESASYEDFPDTLKRLKLLVRAALAQEMDVIRTTYPKAVTVSVY